MSKCQCALRAPGSRISNFHLPCKTTSADHEEHNKTQQSETTSSTQFLQWWALHHGISMGTQEQELQFRYNFRNIWMPTVAVLDDPLLSEVKTPLIGPSIHEAANTLQQQGACQLIRSFCTATYLCKDASALELYRAARSSMARSTIKVH